MIPASGTTINLVLTFAPGSTAQLWQGEGPRAKLVQYDISTWSYSIGVGLNLAEIAKGDLEQKIKVPPLAEAHLNNFLDQMFTVRHLLLDFQSVDLIKAANGSAPGASDKGAKAFVEFMAFYLKETTSNGNPYILGYSLTTTEQTKIPPDQQVPDQLRPVGATFSLFRDPTDPENSTLNFVLVTKGGHGRVQGNPPIFDSNWLRPEEPGDGKVIYAHNSLVEPFIVRPLFNQIRESVYNSIKGSISVGIGNDYGAAKQIAPGRWAFNIATNRGGNDRYQNQFTMQIINQGNACVLQFHGNVYVFKEVSKDCFVCTARAHANAAMEWAGFAAFQMQPDGKGGSALGLQNGFNITGSRRDGGKNTCADAFDWMGRIIGTVGGIFSSFLVGGLFGNLLSEVFSVQIPGVGNINAAVSNVANATRSLIMLPSGQVFNFQSPACNPQGDLSLLLSYR